ncbi:MAG: peptidase [Segetibacter sp.]|nr:peptidase [Segetibacter sp.]
MVETIVLVLIAVAAVALLFYAVFLRKRERVPIKVVGELTEDDRKTLEEYVVFYEQLSPEKRLEFEQRLQHFLTSTRITGVNVEVERLDELLVASSAIIPIFSFTDWEYINLNEVLLYPDSFDEKFKQEGDERTTLGLVGDGPYQNVMVLSKHELRQGFLNKASKNNTAIHEFVHLIDKTDGAVDGVPETLIPAKYVSPWMKLIRSKISEILENKSDINPYGATNEAEFLAVVSEYFFERPDLLHEKHPELYEWLSKMFRKQPV